MVFSQIYNMEEMSENLLDSSNKLNHIREEASILLHHDAAAGTLLKKVEEDYV